MIDKRLALVLELRKDGHRLMKSLKEVGLEYYTYLRLCHDAGIPRRRYNQKTRRTYTLEVVEKVKKRIETGQFLKDICESMGLDSRNLARFCRINGMKLYNEETIRLNYQKRVRRPRNKKSKRIIIIKHLKKGKNPEAIAKKLSVTPAYVQCIDREMKKNPDQF